MLAIPELGRRRQENHKFTATLGYTVSQRAAWTTGGLVTSQMRNCATVKPWIAGNLLGKS